MFKEINSGVEKMASQNFKYVIFLVLLFVILSAAVWTVSNINVVAANGLWILLAGLFIMMAWKGDLLLQLDDYERAVVRRVGRVARVGGPGWTLILPFIESYSIVDLRTQTIDVPKQQIITKGKIELGIDAVIYLSVAKDKASVIKSVVEVEDYKTAAKLYVIAALRDVLGTMTLDDVISNITSVNSKLKEGLKELCLEWGVQIENVEIKDVDIPKVVLDSMHNEKAAEQEKLARMQKAQAHEYEIETVKKAAEQLSDKALAYYYVKALEKLGEGKSTKFLFPMEITKLASSIAKGAGSEPDLENLFKKYAPVIKGVLSQSEKRQAERKARKEKK